MPTTRVKTSCFGRCSPSVPASPDSLHQPHAGAARRPPRLRGGGKGPHGDLGTHAVSTNRERLATALSTLSERLEEHLVEEERDVVPLIAIHITQAEWDHLGQVAFSKFMPQQRFSAMGEMLEAAGPEEAARMRPVAMPVRVISRLIGHRKYSRFMNSVPGRYAAGLPSLVSRSEDAAAERSGVRFR